MSFLSEMQEMASKVGWSAVHPISDTLVVIPFDSGDDLGRIDVFIRPCGAFRGKTVLEFSSPGLPIPDDSETKLAMMQLLLERSGAMVHGHWAIEAEADQKRFSVMVTQLADTMDAQDFEAAVGAVLTEFSGFLLSMKKAGPATAP
jgi:hypothetical protein